MAKHYPAHVGLAGSSAQRAVIPDCMAIEQKRLLTMQGHALVEPKKRVAVQRPLYAMKEQVLGGGWEGLLRCAIPREAEAREAEQQHDPSGGFGHSVGWRIDCRRRECRPREAMYRRCDEGAKKSGAVCKHPDDLSQVVDSFGIREDAPGTSIVVKLPFVSRKPS